MADIKARFRKKADEVGAEIKDLLKEHGSKTIGEVQLSQIYQGMRGMTGLVSETSLLDSQEGIRFRGYSIPELQKKLPLLSRLLKLMSGRFWYLIFMLRVLRISGYLVSSLTITNL